MIIECVNCSKKFNVNSDLIPSNGRTIQCGACGHVWFFKKNDQKQTKINEIETIDNFEIFKQDVKSDSDQSKSNSKKEKISPTKGSELVKYKSKSNFTFAKFIALIILFIISFIALILVLDTFKSPIYNLIPSLEIWLFNLYEILKDIKLFIRDLF
tara:strand:+ start:24 stop:491 length:468 start_codon:yes stop_codon:yes gene_type:complete